MAFLVSYQRFVVIELRKMLLDLVILDQISPNISYFVTATAFFSHFIHTLACVYIYIYKCLGIFIHLNTKRSDESLQISSSEETEFGLNSHLHSVAE